MTIVSRLLKDLKWDLSLDDSQVERLSAYVNNQLEDVTLKNVTSVIPIYSQTRKKFIAAVDIIETHLSELFNERELLDIIDNFNARPPLAIINDTEIISADELVYIPTRRVDNPLIVFAQIFSTSLNRILRISKILKQKKLTKFELDELFKKTCSRIFFINKEAFLKNKISQQEHKFIDDLVNVLNVFYMVNISINKRVPIKENGEERKGEKEGERDKKRGRKPISVKNDITINDIAFVISIFKKLKMLSRNNVNKLRAILLDEKIVKCENEKCGCYFVQKRTTQRFCESCSKKSGYYNKRRALKGALTWGGLRQGAGKKKKKITD